MRRLPAMSPYRTTPARTAPARRAAYPRTPRPLRRGLAFCLLLLACCFSLLPSGQAAEENRRKWTIEDDGAQGPTDVPGHKVNDLRELADAVVKTGVKPGGIPAITRPQFLSISDASLSMDDEEIVFLVQHGPDLVRIYPRRVLVWHECVNDTVSPPDAPEATQFRPGEPDAEQAFTISYSPLSGSVVGFRSLIGKYPSYFGSSGELLNGNSILFDFISHTMWSQLLAGALEGTFRGKRLERIQVTWARWGGVKERYGGLNSDFTGKAEVLSSATGHRRTYGRDPYGSYDNPGSYYNNNQQLPFTLTWKDGRLPPKTRILGIETDREWGALVKDEVRARQLLNFELGGIPMLALYDELLDAVRVFDRAVEGRSAPLTFAVTEKGLTDRETGTEWSPAGLGRKGLLEGRQLFEVLSVDSMWFAWAAFYRASMIIPESAQRFPQ